MHIKTGKLNIRSVIALLTILILLGVVKAWTSCGRESSQTDAEEETVEETVEYEPAEEEMMTEETESVEQGALGEIPIPTPTPLFDIVNGETIWLSITREQLKEYTKILREGLNLNDAALAGILSNIQAESGFNPNKYGDMGTAFGICQWQGARLDQMVSYCERENLDPLTVEAQMSFLIFDLKNNYIYPFDLIRACSDNEQGAAQAAFYFCAYYEVPVDLEEKSPAREELTKLLIYPTLKEFGREA